MTSPASNGPAEHRPQRGDAGLPGGPAGAVGPAARRSRRGVVDHRGEVRDGDFAEPEVAQLRDQQAPVGPVGGADNSRRRVDEAWELALAAADLADAEWREMVARRRVERQLGAVQRRARLEEQRAAGDMYAGEERTPNRPTHVDVDPEAWATVKQRAFERGLLVASAVAELVVRAVDEGVTPQRNPQRPRSTTRRFARVFVDDGTWGAFRARAVEADVTVARLVGLIVEAEARRLGWRPGVGR